MPEPHLMVAIMVRSLLMAGVFLVAGCAGMEDSAYMPSEAQLRWQNPQLLNCPVGHVATCESSTGGRVSKRYTNCRCTRGMPR